MKRYRISYLDNGKECAGYLWAADLWAAVAEWRMTTTVPFAEVYSIECTDQRSGELDANLLALLSSVYNLLDYLSKPHMQSLAPHAAQLTREKFIAYDPAIWKICEGSAAIGAVEVKREGEEDA